MDDTKITNALFIHIPKTAGTAIEKSLGFRRIRYPSIFDREFNNKGMCGVGHLDIRKRIANGKITKEFYDSAFKFCFCRNPYDRTVSHYFYARHRHPGKFPPSVTFKDYTRTFADYGKMFRPQTWYTYNLNFDFIGRFENLDNDFNIIAEILDIDAKLITTNVTRHLPYWEYYDEEAADNVIKFYREDFEFFGYDENDRLLSIFR